MVISSSETELRDISAHNSREGIALVAGVVMTALTAVLAVGVWADLGASGPTFNEKVFISSTSSVIGLLALLRSVRAYRRLNDPVW